MISLHSATSCLQAYQSGIRDSAASAGFFFPKRVRASETYADLSKNCRNSSVQAIGILQVSVIADAQMTLKTDMTMSILRTTRRILAGSTWSRSMCSCVWSNSRASPAERACDRSGRATTSTWAAILSSTLGSVREGFMLDEARVVLRVVHHAQTYL